MDREDTGRDLVVTQGEMALVKDGSNGPIDVIVGPYVYNMPKQDVPVQFDAEEGRFERCSAEEAIQLWPVVKEGQYVALQNPAQGDPDKHPEAGEKKKAIPLDVGRRINIPGPTTFALYPGQSAEVINGHILRTNQYLLVRIINGEEAMKHWAMAILKPQTTPPEDADYLDPDTDVDDEESLEKTAESKSKATEEIRPDEDVPNLVTGQLLIIKGTEVSFFMPMTGAEVLADGGKYIKDAVTLEQLELCILLDEDGTKEFVYGPDVVFPRPTQIFHKDEEGTRKFRAVELNELMGIYLKVIKSYSESGVPIGEGEELFITGKDQKIYWPRAEHSIIRYGDRDIHFAVAIPKGETRYVLDRSKGKVELVEGPIMFLPDPRKEVVIKRSLPLSLVQLLYPSNSEALEYNRPLREDEPIPLSAASLSAQQDFGSREYGEDRVTYRTASFSPEPVAELVGEEFQRGTEYTPPRTIELDTKYAGAPKINIWTGYAVKIVNATGESRIVVGPGTVHLAYDEIPEVFELSTGTPKSDDNIHRDVYLRVKANKVSDFIEDVETSDFVKVSIPISYRVNFEGDTKKFFDVENYVKFLTDHLRSLIANTVKQIGIEEFNKDYINILRNAILGKATEEAERPGRLFEENGMRIYDVELSKLFIGDSDIGDMLQDSQHDSVRRALTLASSRKELEAAKEEELITQDTEEAKNVTRRKRTVIEREAVERLSNLEVLRIVSLTKQQELRLKGEVEEQGHLNKIEEERLGRQKAEEEVEREHAKALVRIEVDAVVDRASAVTPDLIEAIQVFADKDLAGKLAKAMSPLAILGGSSITDVFAKLIQGTPLAEQLKLLEGRRSRRDMKTKEDVE